MSSRTTSYSSTSPESEAYCRDGQRLVKLTLGHSGRVQTCAALAATAYNLLGGVAAVVGHW